MTKEEFLHDVSEWSSHRPLLFWALEIMKHSVDPVVEFGSGDGSTKFIRQYCIDNSMKFLTYDSNKEWAGKTGSTYIENFRTAGIYGPMSVALVDNAPGETRHEIMAIIKDICPLIVVHDSQEPGYELEKIWPLFKYRYDYKEFNTMASIVSNTIDVSLIKDL